MSTQETFLVVARGLDRYDEARGPFGAYLYGIARNLLMKRAGRERPFVALGDDQDLMRLRPAIRRGPRPPSGRRGRPTGRADAAGCTIAEVVVLVELQGLPYEEVAAALVVPGRHRAFAAAPGPRAAGAAAAGTRRRAVDGAASSGRGDGIEQVQAGPRRRPPGRPGARRAGPGDGSTSRRRRPSRLRLREAFRAPVGAAVTPAPRRPSAWKWIAAVGAAAGSSGWRTRRSERAPDRPPPQTAVRPETPLAVVPGEAAPPSPPSVAARPVRATATGRAAHDHAAAPASAADRGAVRAALPGRPARGPGRRAPRPRLGAALGASRSWAGRRGPERWTRVELDAMVGTRRVTRAVRFVSQ